jgi:hypothetical protein
MAEGDSGFSQQDPSDAGTEPNSQLFVIQQLIAKISTLKIVKVLSVSVTAPGRGTVDVQPMVDQVDGENNATPHGTIYGIPYCSWQYGKNAVLADPAVDDMGIMVCADRDISGVKSAKAIAPPGSSRQYDAADGVYMGGLLGTDAPEQYVKFADDGMEIADKNANKLVSGPAGWRFIGAVVFEQTVNFEAVITAQQNLQLAGDLKSGSGGRYAGDLHTSGTVTGDAAVMCATVSLTGHHHTAQGAFAATTPAQA